MGPLEKELSPFVRVYKLYGGLKKKEREEDMDELQNLSENSKSGIIATSKYMGEGDYSILDTLVLALPIRIYDYLDTKIDLAMKMHENRSKGYRSMSYEIMEGA